jgi:hypothetical protein
LLIVFYTDNTNILYGHFYVHKVASLHTRLLTTATLAARIEHR